MKTTSFLSRITLVHSLVFWDRNPHDGLCSDRLSYGVLRVQMAVPHAPLLTADEKAQLTKDRDAALAANPDLKTRGDNF